jgi:hypothetical protein
MNWKLNYIVTVDWLPFREWHVQAESESEARLEISRMLGVAYEQMDAQLEGGK